VLMPEPTSLQELATRRSWPISTIGTATHQVCIQTIIIVIITIIIIVILIINNNKTLFSS